MKKIVLLAGLALSLFTSLKSEAQVRVNIQIGAPVMQQSWYDYDDVTHVLTPFPIVWVVKTADGSHVKLVIESYYDAAGTSGHFTWRWAPMVGGGGS